MPKKIDLQSRLNALVNEIQAIKKGIDVPLVIMRNPPANCTGMRIIPFNERETISIRALIAWAAMENRMQENTVEAWLLAWADVDNMDDIGQNRYDEVIRFLVDFNAKVN